MTDSDRLFVLPMRESARGWVDPSLYSLLSSKQCIHFSVLGSVPFSVFSPYYFFSKILYLSLSQVWNYIHLMTWFGMGSWRIFLLCGKLHSLLCHLPVQFVNRFSFEINKEQECFSLIMFSSLVTICLFVYCTDIFVPKSANFSLI